MWKKHNAHTLYLRGHNILLFSLNISVWGDTLTLHIQLTNL